MRAGKRRTAVVVVALWAAPHAACSRINPAFSDDEAASGTGGGTTGDATTSPGSMTAESGGQEGSATSGSSGGPGSDSSSSSGERPMDSGTDAGEVCELLPEDSAFFEVLIGDTVIPPPDDCDEVLEWADGSMLVIDGAIYHQECKGCLCNVQGGLIINFGGAVDLPTLTNCGNVLIWAGYDSNGECRWDGVAVFNENQTTIPDYFVLNSRHFPVDHFGHVPIEFAGDSDCLNPGQCDQAPGSYDLGFFNGDTASVGEMTEVEIAFYASVPFRVHNRMSFIDPVCGEHVAWTGLQM